MHTNLGLSDRPVSEFSDNRQYKLESDSMSTADHALSLCRFGLSERSLGDLEQLPHKIQNWSRRIRSLQSFPSYKALFSDKSHQTLQSLQWLAGFYERPLVEPDRFSLLAHPEHCLSETPALFRAAKKHASDIQQRLSQHSDYLDFNALPTAAVTLQNLRVLTGRQYCLPFSRRKREARYNIDFALYEGETLSSHRVKRRLNELYDLYEEMLNFSDNTLYKRHLGPQFKGVTTHWDELKSYVKFSQALSFACGDDQAAVQLVRNWESLGGEFETASKKAASVRKDLDKLARLTTLFTGEPDTDPTLDRILGHARIARTDIEQHLAILSMEVTDNTLTPKTIVQMRLG